MQVCIYNGRFKGNTLNVPTLVLAFEFMGILSSINYMCAFFSKNVWRGSFNPLILEYKEMDIELHCMECVLYIARENTT